METVRLFVGLALPTAIRETLARALDDWRRQLPEVHWEEPEALHITLQFVGNFPAARLPEMEGGLARVKARSFALRCAGTGAFPDPKRPRLVWAGVAGAPELTQLAAAIAIALAPLGITAEARPFVPHISLARIQHAGALRGWTIEPTRPLWGEGEVTGFQLFKSVAGAPRAQRYPALRRFALSQSR